jgi:hypothetical protein
MGVMGVMFPGPRKRLGKGSFLTKKSAATDFSKNLHVRLSTLPLFGPEISRKMPRILTRRPSD